MDPSHQQGVPSDSSHTWIDSPGDAGEGTQDRSPEQAPDTWGRCVVCEVHRRVPSIRGHAWSYYISCQDGSPMLTLDRRKGESVRISGVLDVVVVEIFNGRVTLGLRCTADDPGPEHCAE